MQHTAEYEDDLDETEKMLHDVKIFECPWSDVIPEEILLKILHMGAVMHGSVPYLCRVAQVCRRWQYLSYHPSLWETVDLSIGWISRDIQGLRLLCGTRLQNTKALDLTSWFKINDGCLQCLIENCRNLTSLNLSHCEQLTPLGMEQLATSRLPLEELDLSFTPPPILSKNCIRNLLMNLGRNLRKLNLSNNLIDNEFSLIVYAIAKYCSNLEHLDVSHLGDVLMTRSWVFIHMERLQEKCRNLRVLLMANSPLKLIPVPEQYQIFSPGFPKLTRFSAPSGLKDSSLQRILKSSFNLETLKITMELAHDIHYTRIPAMSLRKLVVQRARASQLHLKWHHSLEVLDFSWIKLAGTWNTNDRLETDFQRIFSPEGPKFEVLHTILLCGSPVTVNCLRSIFECCPKLNTLNLVLCGLLPSGWHQEYTGTSLTFFKHEMLGIPLPGS